MTGTGDDDIRAPERRSDDFLGAFAVIERPGSVLMVQNRRTIGGAEVLTWDLPGGQVEPGELLGEALARELREEVGVAVVAPPRFLFVQEGERARGGARRYVWRSFFFACDVAGEPQAGAEVVATRWMAREELFAVLRAPYHDSFAAWLSAGGAFHASGWRD